MFEKSDYLRKKLQIIQKFIFSPQVWKGENPNTCFNLLEITFLVQSTKTGQKLPKIVFLLKMSNIKLI